MACNSRNYWMRNLRCTTRSPVIGWNTRNSCSKFFCKLVTLRSTSNNSSANTCRRVSRKETKSSQISPLRVGTSIFFTLTPRLGAIYAMAVLAYNASLRACQYGQRVNCRSTPTCYASRSGYSFCCETFLPGPNQVR